MKVENEAILRCPNCRVEGRHGLLYLSNRLRASRCDNCGYTQMFSGHIYAEYARDVTDRATSLPRRLAGQAIRHPLDVFGWPAKALLKPLGLLSEVGKVTDFERRSHRRPATRG
ncbi:hypothetical protein GBA65_08465 [Rubrobacter marinus]|uniref:Uncharacterized protein n=1 Tax=Rubrobacter marinus TaxID=2653852 RepID=A0A6G8PWF9_9ACTN|nr:hypothetical protein [Rubrobacter marinus]QIN78549.1 hypothetical protein GBA65_08465 [Rubrobacter marinus]